MSKIILSVTAIFLIAVVVNSSNAQLSRYSFSCGSTTWAPITGSPGPNSDDQTIQVTIPFTFVYLNTGYTTISICSNGWLVAGNSSNADYTNTLCATPILNMIAPFWDDLYPPGGGTIQYTTVGVSPNRQFVVQYLNVAHYAGSPCCITFQVRLYEGSGLIEYIYGPGNTTTGWTGSIGLNEPPGGSTHIMSVTAGTDCPGTTMSRTACNDNVDIPNLVSGRVYRFSPAPQPSYYNTAWCTPPYPSIPAATIYNACAWIGDTLYMQSPDATGNATTTVRRYSLSGNAWTTGVSLPVAKTQGTMTAANNKLYYIGGGATPGGTGSTDVFEYNPATGLWLPVAPIPAAVNGHGAANWGDSVIFVVMGPWNSPSTSCYFYRIGNNTWGTTTAFTGGATRGHACAIWANKIYVAGGFTGSSYTKQFYIGTIGADASTISWSAGPPFPSVPKAYLGGIAAGDRFYIVGGNNSIGSTSSDSTFFWGILGGYWTALASIKPVAVHNIEAAVTYRLVGDTVRIFVPGGSSGAGTTTNFDVIACGPTVTGLEQGTPEIPSEYGLMQNYPNPFNPTTVITYALPKPGDVRLTVYDVLGKEIAVLVNEYKHAGRHTVEFDGSRASSGVYFYRIDAGEFKDVKKMLLVK